MSAAATGCMPLRTSQLNRQIVQPRHHAWRDLVGFESSEIVSTAKLPNHPACWPRTCDNLHLHPAGTRCSPTAMPLDPAADTHSHTHLKRPTHLRWLHLMHGNNHGMTPNSRQNCSLFRSAYSECYFIASAINCSWLCFWYMRSWWCAKGNNGLPRAGVTLDGRRGLGCWPFGLVCASLPVVAAGSSQGSQTAGDRQANVQTNQMEAKLQCRALAAGGGTSKRANWREGDRSNGCTLARLVQDRGKGVRVEHGRDTGWHKRRALQGAGGA